MWVYIHRDIEHKQVYTQEQLKLIHINVSIHINSYVFKIYHIKNTYFYAVKQKNWK